MASPSGTPNPDPQPPDTAQAAIRLTNRLFERPYSFHFFQACRRLENAHAHLPRIGYSRRPAQDPVRFGQEPSLRFPPASIEKLQFGQPGRPHRLFITFFGLTGPNGPMPLDFTEHARRRDLSGDHTVARFCDVFNHRMCSLFYRAWAACQQPVQFERGPAQDRYAVYAGSLFGIGMTSLRHRDAVPDVAKLHYSGRLVCQARHAEGLSAILSDYFRITCRIVEFFGQWLDLPPPYQCRLGESPRTGSLGTTAIVGSRIWDVAQKFRVQFGPMTLAEYERLLPGGDSMRRFAAWVRNYIGDELTCDLQLILKKEEVPETKMGTFGRLGWTTWLVSGPATKDADDLVLQPLEARV